MNITTELYDYQVPAVEKGCKKKFLLNTLKTGQGKTLVELAIAANLYNRGLIDLVVILTPRNAYDEQVWVKNVKDHTDTKIQDIENYINRKKLTANILYGKHTHIKTYGAQIRRLVALHKTFLIIDEVHNFKNPNSELSLKMRGIRRAAKVVHGLTATPLSKSLEDAYNIIDLVRPGALGSFDTFKKTYCTTYEEVIGRMPSGKLRKVEKIAGFKDEDLFHKVTSHFILKGKNSIVPKFHFTDYRLNAEEHNIYRKIAKGISVSDDELVPEGWLKSIIQSDDVTDAKMAADITAHSSRFIYLQYAADGIINSDGTLGRIKGTKFNLILNQLKEIVSKKQSAIVYFSFHASLQTFEYLLRRHIKDARILKSTGKDTLDANQVTAETCKKVPHIILCTKAGSSAVSYHFINHALIANYPTVPDTMTQFIGRITRANTIYKNDLHVYMYRCPNIDDYKLLVVSHKTGVMETVAGEEGNIPTLFKSADWSARSVKKYKNKLLWYALY